MTNLPHKGSRPPPVVWLVGHFERPSRWAGLGSGLGVMAAWGPRLLAVAGLLALVFALDLLLAPGGAVPALSLAALALLSPLPWRNGVLWGAMVASGLTVLASLLGPDLDALVPMVINRLIALVVIWGGALLLIRWKELLDDLERCTNETEAASRSKTRFLSTAGHDLRHPIQAGVLFHDLLMRRLRGTPHEELVVGVGQALEMMQAMVNGLLELSRLEAGRLEVQRVHVPIEGVFSRLSEQFLPQARTAGLTLTLVGSRAMVWSDPEQLTRIIQELVTNALIFTKHGRVLVGCRRAGAFLRIQVWDTGCGIPTDRLPELCGEFQQLRSQSGDAGKRLGLGLSVVDRLARQLGHPVGVCSVEGRGSMFEVVVPRVGGPGSN